MQTKKKKCELLYQLIQRMFSKTCMERLEKRFPKSPRVKILQGMKLEAADRLDEALELYDEILKNDDSNIVGKNFFFLSRIIQYRSYQPNKMIYC